MPAYVSPFDLERQEMEAMWREVQRLACEYVADLPGLPVAPRLNPALLRDKLSAVDFERPQPWRETLLWVDRMMREEQLHPGHPRYFGLFNPAPVPLGIAGEALAAAYNPQLAAWSHSPFANELERLLIRQFGRRFGYPAGGFDGAFCTGGSEANHTALLCALVQQFPGYAAEGSRSLPGNPTVYVSQHAHHSWMKAARACGLGSAAVRVLRCGEDNRFSTQILSQALLNDRRTGFCPALIVATAGTTGAGMIDPLAGIAAIAEEQTCWYHVDAAWGGAACFAPEHTDLLTGIERADSITLDLHKFLSAPMGAGVFLTRNCQSMTAAFAVSADYMPRDAELLQAIEPYAHTMQWSRRFIGLKVFLALAAVGWEGVAEAIRHQVDLGRKLRQALSAEGWNCLNDTPLPLVCFAAEGPRDPSQVERIAKWVVESGRAWISTVDFGGPALRACITNFRSAETDIAELVRALGDARQVASMKRNCTIGDGPVRL